MTRRRWVSVALFAALLAAVAGFVRLPRATSAAHTPFPPVGRSAANQLPTGFVLPSSDVDLKISSLVAADLDADGDLDIVAADPAKGSIVVWVNDGGGRLTRKRPAQTKTLGGEPAAPSVDEQHSTVVVSVQSDAPAIEAIGANAWLSLPAERCELPLSPSHASADRSTLRSRSPPAVA